MTKQLDYGYGIYSIPCGFAVADPEDGPDGFYLTVETLEAAEAELALWVEERMGGHAN